MMNRKAADGNYTVNFNGKEAAIYCHNMSTDSPKEYINLMKNNFFYVLDGGWANGLVVRKNKTTFYSKVAVNMTVSPTFVDFSGQQGQFA